MKEKRILIQLHEFFGVNIGQRILLDKDAAKRLSDLSLSDVQLEFVMQVSEFSEGGAVASITFGRAPKALIMLLQKNAPISNKFEITFSGVKMPEIQMSIVL